MTRRWFASCQRLLGLCLTIVKCGTVHSIVKGVEEDTKLERLISGTDRNRFEALDGGIVDSVSIRFYSGRWREGGIFVVDDGDGTVFGKDGSAHAAHSEARGYTLS